MRKADIAVALVLMAVGIAVVTDSLRLGTGWGKAGPGPGFFPFYLGLGVILCTVSILLKALRMYKKDGAGKPLIGEGGLSQILWVLIPATGMVLLTELVGLHIATIFYLGFYMKVVGKMNWISVVIIGVLVPLSTYVVFDKIFLIPLPEGVWGKYLIPF
jgi:putative tricarboxylic transport membrane protein